MSRFGPLVAAPLARHRVWECIACKETAPSATGARYFACPICIDKADVVLAELREAGSR